MSDENWKFSRLIFDLFDTLEEWKIPKSVLVFVIILGCILIKLFGILGIVPTVMMAHYITKSLANPIIFGGRYIFVMTLQIIPMVFYMIIADPLVDPLGEIFGDLFG